VRAPSLELEGYIPFCHAVIVGKKTVVQLQPNVFFVLKQQPQNKEADDESLSDDESFGSTDHSPATAEVSLLKTN
jgi:hypothetical protein